MRREMAERLEGSLLLDNNETTERAYGSDITFPVYNSRLFERTIQQTADFFKIMRFRITVEHRLVRLR